MATTTVSGCPQRKYTCSASNSAGHVQESLDICTAREFLTLHSSYIHTCTQAYTCVYMLARLVLYEVYICAVWWYGMFGQEFSVNVNESSGVCFLSNLNLFGS